MPNVPKIKESAFSANHFLLKLIVLRAEPSTLAHFSSLQTLVTFNRNAFAGIANCFLFVPENYVLNDQIKLFTVLYPQTTLFGNAYFFKMNIYSFVFWCQHTLNKIFPQMIIVSLILYNILIINFFTAFSCRKESRCFFLDRQ